ncbi:efflux RND transporter permease subunit [Micrococcus sp. ACRRV]|uniref:efflux RND transporter permease subunit n=1 Tax=Micrococcus sp. ACRRV TaxID=2918203 RepID=UPI001EF20E58|nr:efflux RND transporter permease subunit [Micrococcus sp. ACRRV]MCG7422874.1 efflux RND transporter permease subunit [Micrococcus sp. ACRRV]
MGALARFSLSRRALVALVTAFIAVFGVLSAGLLKRELIPSLELPVISVSTTYPGASPEVVDAEIGQPLEQALQAVEGLDSSASTSATSFNSVQLRFRYGTDLTRARSQVDRVISNLASQLPEEAQTTSFAGSVSDFPVVFLALSGDEDLNALKRRAEDVLVPRLQRIDGVRGAQVLGGTEEYVSVVPDAAKLAAAGLTTQDVTTALEENAGLFPIGQATSGTVTYPVQAGTPVGSVADLEQVTVTPGGGQSSTGAADQGAGAEAGGGGPGAATGTPARLGDVAAVSMQAADPTSVTRTDGAPTLSLSVTATPDADLVAVSHAVADALPELESLAGSGAKLTVVFDQAPFIEQSIRTLFVEGLLGLAMAILVIAVFLLSARSTMVTAVSIPLSLLTALIGVAVFGYSLNTLTLGALTISIGRVVDDAIVVVENIRRHLGLGADKRTAILEGTREVATAITASTLVSVAVFLPIAFVDGLAGELFRPFAVTTSIALLASLVVALTIVPVLCWWFLRAPRAAAAPGSAEGVSSPVEDAAEDTWLARAYRPVLRWTQRHAVATLAGAAALLAGTVALAPLIPTNLLGDSGQNSFVVTAQQAPGTSLEATTAAAGRIEAALRDTPGVRTVQFTAGSAGGAMGAFGRGSADRATFTVVTDPDADQTALQDEVRGRLAGLGDVGEVDVSAQQGPAGGQDITVSVTAPDPEALADGTDRVAEALGGLDGVLQASTPSSDVRPTFQVDVDTLAAAERGLTEKAVSGQVAAALQAVPVGTVRFGFQEFTVRLGDPDPVESLGALRAVPISTPSGPVPLSELADVRRADVPAQVTSSNGQRTAEVTVTPDPADLGGVSRRVSDALEGVALPDGVEATVGGAATEQAKTFRDLGLALLAAIAAVYVVMVATFNSLRQPFVLLVSIPFAATGVVLALLASGTALGVATMIGLLMLVGIVVTNAIVLIDLINQYRRRHGMALDEAIERGALHRVRPVVMTALATVLAMTPMALGITGHAGFISQPLAVAVVGGLASSTVLTLVLVPVLYRLTEARGERRIQAERAAREAEERELAAREARERELAEREAAARAVAGPATAAHPAPAGRLSRRRGWRGWIPRATS